MEYALKQQLQGPARNFRLPRYAEITNVGLYLDQVTRFVNTYLSQIGCAELTPSMVSNYVKQKTIPGPARKSYSADSIAYLVFVAFVKNVVSMEDIRLLEEMQRASYSTETAYDYFCAEFENVLRTVFGVQESMGEVGVTHTEQKEILRTVILASVRKIYLDGYLRAVRQLPPIPGAR
jgi:hypothetical protein